MSLQASTNGLHIKRVWLVLPARGRRHRGRAAERLLVALRQYSRPLLPFSFARVLVRTAVGVAVANLDRRQVLGHVLGRARRPGQVQAVTQTPRHVAVLLVRGGELAALGRGEAAAPRPRLEHVEAPARLASAGAAAVLGAQVLVGLVVVNNRGRGRVDDLLGVRVGPYKGELGAGEPVDRRMLIRRVFVVESILLLEHIAETHF